jgi:hypothetical protein
MKAEKYLKSIGLENVIDEEFFNDDDKSWYKVQELMEAYHQAKLDLLTIPVVVGQSEQLLAFAKHLQPKEDVSLLMNEVSVFIHENK